MDLRSHLESFGIRHFADDSYWGWGASVLGYTRAVELDKLRRPLVDGDASPRQELRFYDYIANPTVAGVVHSLKADAIRVSGEFVTRHLPSAGRILDVGCGSGYLTTYYAAMAPEATVVGCDVSKESIKSAGAEADKRGLSNLQFVRANIEDDDPGGRFDCVCSTQVLAYLPRMETALARIAAMLPEGGHLISVEPLGTAEAAAEFLASAARCNLAIQLVEFQYYSDLGNRGAYPGMLLKRGGTSIEVDLAAEYADAEAALQRQA